MRLTIDDLPIFERIMKDESVYPFITDDGSPPASENDICRALLSVSAGIYVLSPNEFTALVFIKQNTITYELHTMVTKQGRGKIAVPALSEVADWIFENTSCRKVRTWIPSFNRPARWMVRRMGFAHEGCEHSSFLKGGILYDQDLFGLTKEEWLCQQQQ